MNRWYARTGCHDGLASTPGCALRSRSLSCTRVAHHGDLPLTTTAGGHEERRVGPRALPHAPRDLSFRRGSPFEEQPTETHTIRSPIRSGPRDASLALPRTGSLARAGEGAQPLPPTAPRVAERSGQRASDPLLRGPSFERPLEERMGPGARSLLSSRLPREH